MKISHMQTEAIDILAVSGRIDAVTSPDFESQLLDLVKKVNVGCVLDFDGVDYVSSAGLRVNLLRAVGISIAFLHMGSPVPSGAATGI